MSAVVGYLRSRDQELADRILSAWATRWLQVGKFWDSRLYRLSDLDSGVAKVVSDRNETLKPRPSVLDAVMRVSGGGWGPPDETAINEASAEEMERTIEALDKSSFGQFVHFFKEQRSTPLTRNSGAIFERGITAFFAAADVLRAKPGRLANLLDLYLS